MRTLLVCGLLLICPAWARAQALPEDLAHIPGDAVAFVHARTADFWKGPYFKMYRDMLPKGGADAIAILDDRIAPPLTSVDRVTVVILAPGQRGPGIAVLLHTSKPLETRKLIQGLKEMKDGETTYYLLPREGSMSILNKNTLMLGSNDAALALAHRAKAPAAFEEALALAGSGKKAVVAAMNTSTIPQQVWGKTPPMLRPFGNATAVLATLDFGKELVLDVDFRFGDAEQARDAERSLGEIRQLGKTGLAQAKLDLEKKLAAAPRVVPLYEFDKIGEVMGPVFGLAMIKRGEDLLDAVPVKRTDERVAVKFVVPEELSNYATAGPMLIALLVPAVQKVREAAERTQDANNLKQMALAYHFYYDANKHFPAPAICDKTGKPLLSWRVSILPYIEQEALYKEFKLDEPWDSDHNIKLLPKMPVIYRFVGDDAGDSQTYYRVFVGPNKNPSALFRTYDERVKMKSITHGTSNTLLIVPAAESVPWTKPEELVFPEKGPLPRLNQLRRGCNVAFCDGSVRFLSSTIAEKTLRELITRDAD